MAVSIKVNYCTLARFKSRIYIEWIQISIKIALFKIRVNIRLFRNRSVPIWISTREWSVCNTDRQHERNIIYMKSKVYCFHTVVFSLSMIWGWSFLPTALLSAATLPKETQLLLRWFEISKYFWCFSEAEYLNPTILLENTQSWLSKFGFFEKKTMKKLFACRNPSLNMSTFRNNNIFFVFQSVATGYMLAIVARFVLWSFRSKRTQISCYKRLKWRFWLRSKAKQFSAAMVKNTGPKPLSCTSVSYFCASQKFSRCYKDTRSTLGKYSSSNNWEIFCFPRNKKIILHALLEVEPQAHESVPPRHRK